MNIRLKLILTFLVITIISVVIISVVYYEHARQMVEEQTLNQLQSVSKLQEHRLQKVITILFERLNVISSQVEFRYKLLLETADSTPEHYEMMNLTLFRAVDPIPAFKTAWIIDTSGVVLVASDTSMIGAHYTNLKLFIKAKTERSIDQFFLNEQGESRVIISGPLIWQEEVVGILGIESTLEDFEELVGDYTGLGETGETVLAKRTSGDTALFITSARFDPEASLKRKIPLDQEQYAIVHAFKGRDTLFTDKLDYKNHPVYASVRYIERMDWGLASKITVEQALQPIRQLQAIFFTGVILSSLIITAIVVFIANKITFPLRQLIKGVDRVKKRDFSYQIEVQSKDELGALAIGFNQMTRELRELTRNLEDKIQQLETANTDLEQFAYIVSHDLKAPLRGIKSLADFIIEDHADKLGEEGKEQINLLNEKVKEMEELITGILEYSRAGKKEQAEQMDVNELVKDVVQILQPPAHIAVSIEKKLPVITTSKVPLMQIFQNLLSNAIKFMDKPKGEIRIGCEEESLAWKFYVADNGPGIDPKYHKKIFQLFQYIDKAKRKESTGVGLAIVKKAVQRLGGKIWLDSELGKGSTFYFTIPK